MVSACAVLPALLAIPLSAATPFQFLHVCLDARETGFRAKQPHYPISTVRWVDMQASNFHSNILSNLYCYVWSYVWSPTVDSSQDSRQQLPLRHCSTAGSNLATGGIVRKFIHSYVCKNSGIACSQPSRGDCVLLAQSTHASPMSQVGRHMQALRFEGRC